jgi:hypothetical protein
LLAKNDTATVSLESEALYNPTNGAVNEGCGAVRIVGADAAVTIIDGPSPIVKISPSN